MSTSNMVEPHDSQVFSRRTGRKPLVPSSVLAMLIFILTEMMFFAGLISAFLIAKGSATNGWPPPGQPRLPIEETALNTGALLVSGLLLFLANRALRASADQTPGTQASTHPTIQPSTKGTRLFVASIVLGTVFVGFQGAEWVALVREGLTMTTNTHGSFFYLLVGMHALHAVAALIAMVLAYRRLGRGTLKPSTLWATSLFWYFVVLLWPVLYHQVYLS